MQYLITHLWNKRRAAWDGLHYPGRGQPLLCIKSSQRRCGFLNIYSLLVQLQTKDSTITVMKADLFGLLRLLLFLLLIFFLLGLLCLVITCLVFLLGAAVALRLYRPPH